MTEHPDITTPEGRRALSKLFHNPNSKPTDIPTDQLYYHACMNTYAKGYDATKIPAFIEAVEAFLKKHEDTFIIQGEVHALQLLLTNMEL